MPAPDPSLVIVNPPALNPLTQFPYKIDEFPAAALLSGALGSLAPKELPVSAPVNPARLEQR